ncbi:TIR domain-containing protein [Nocardia sp. NPDC059239]|uniref:nSTAND1 domain-containing NTPase n=1 Tax=unclassified Nocardia TaxID=2637762 RepID=UPI0036A887D2
MYRVFLSHSSADRAAAIALQRWLIGQLPSLRGDIFLDVDVETGIAAGTRWRDELTKAVARCEAVLCLISVSWEGSHECLAELRHAETLNKRIFGARLHAEAKGQIAREWQLCDLFDDGPTVSVQADGAEPVTFARDGLQRLLRGLREAGIGAEVSPWPPPDDPDRIPYRGWQPMEEVDAAVFFGRDGQIVRALDALRGMRNSAIGDIFVVLGPSGAGKSSFLRAGLLPRLRQDRRNYILSDIVRPQRAAVTGDHGLAVAVHRLRIAAGFSHPTLGEIKAIAAGDSDRLAGLLRDVCCADHDNTDDQPTLVLPIDQAEELFVSDGAEESGRFRAVLGDVLRTSDLPMIVVVTIRADRYEVMQTAAEFAELRSVVFDELKPMPRTQFREVILGPIARAADAGTRITIESALVDRMLADCAEGADTLPLLALTLYRMYLDYAGDGDMTLAEYEAMGGMRHIVRTEVDTLLATDPAERRAQLELLHTAFIPWLATVDQHTDQPIRRVARWSELPEASHRLIDRFVGRRLLVKGEQHGEAVIEVALESLFRQWDDLERWLTDERDELRTIDTVDRAASGWERSGRDDSWLLTSTRLADAEAVAAKPHYGRRLASANEFLVASRRREGEMADAENRRKAAELRTAKSHARVLRAVAAITFVVALVAVFGLVKFYFAQREADTQFHESTASRLLAESQAMIAGVRPRDDERAIQQLLVAQRIGTSGDDGALVDAINGLSDTRKIIRVGAPTPGTLPDSAQAVANGAALSIAISPDARTIVTGGRHLRLWNADTGEQIDPKRFPDSVLALRVAFSPDGHRIASIGPVFHVWDADSGRSIAAFKPDGDLTSIAFSPDGHRIVSGGSDKSVRLWDADTLAPIGAPMMGHGGAVTSVAFSPDGRWIISGSEDKTVRLWDADSRLQIGEPIAQTQKVVSIAVSPDGHRIVVGSAGTAPAPGAPPDMTDSLRMWDVETHVPFGNAMQGHEGVVTGVAFSPNGDRIVSCGTDGTVRLWDGNTGQPIRTLAGHTGWVEAVAFAGYDRIVSTSVDGTLRVWNGRNQRSAGHILRGQGILHGASIDPGTFSFAPDSKQMAVGTDDGKVVVFNTDTGEPLGELTTGHNAAIHALAYSPDGHGLVSGGDDGTLYFWNADTHEPAGTATVDGTVTNVTYSPNGHSVITSSLLHGHRTLRIWDADTARPRGPVLDTGSGEAHFLSFSPDSRLVVLGDTDQTVRVFAVDTGSAIGPTMDEKDDIGAVHFSADGHRIFVVGGFSLRVWDADDHHPIGGPQPILSDDHEKFRAAFVDAFYSLAVSPTGGYIVTGGATVVHRWNAATGEPIGASMEGHQNIVRSVAVSHDGRYIVSVGDDRTLRYWDGATGRPVGAPLAGPDGWILEMTLSADNKRIVTLDVTFDKRAAVWLWPGPAAWSDELCAKLTANMSRQEWNQWISPKIPYTKSCPGLPIHPDRN